jgi:uncharacterized membrane protein (DUF106 family)
MTRIFDPLFWVMTRIFDALFAPFLNLPPWISLVVFSFVLGVAGVLVYKYASDQPAIQRIKDRIKANVLAIKLFRDELGVMFRSCADVLRCSGVMLRYSLKPLLIMFVPFILVVAQLGLRYQWRPAKQGEELVVRADVSENVDLTRVHPTLKSSEGATVVTPPVRVPTKHQVYWRIRAARPGKHRLRVNVGDDTIEKSLTVGDRLLRVSVLRTHAFWSRFLHPAEKAIPADSSIEAVAVSYPDRDSWFCGSNVWILWLIALSFVSAWLLKPIFRVQF